MAGGRPLGSTNHQSKAIKDMIIGALDKLGGEDYLVEQGQKNPTAFIGLIAKVMPLSVDVTKTQITVNVSTYEQSGLQAASEAVESIH